MSAAEQLDEDMEAFWSPATSGPPCRFYLGCDQIADEEGLCPFHFDAMERTEHAEKQREFEAAVAKTTQELEAKIAADRRRERDIQNAIHGLNLPYEDEEAA